MFQAILVIIGKLFSIHLLEDAPASGWSSLERLVIMLYTNFLPTGVTQIATTLLYLFSGTIDVVTAAARIVSGLVEIGGILIETIAAWLSTLPFWEKAVYTVILFLSIIQFIAEVTGSAGTSTLYKLAVILLALAPILLNLYNDSVDPDSEVG